ncbi:MAG: ExbD/TolR family protein [Opitutales bacterium]|jgi:biopolymer transport protein ExbD
MKELSSTPVPEATPDFRPVTDWLDLKGRVRQPKFKLDVIPVLDLLTLALLMSLLFTRFVISPGVRVDLPQTDLRMQHSAVPVCVLTIENEGMLFYEGRVYELSTIERAFADYIARQEEEAPVLLIKPQAKMELAGFLDLCRMAQEAGFSQVQIAGQKKAAVEELHINGRPLPPLD